MGNINNPDKRFLQEWVQVQKQGAPGTFTNTWIQKKGHRKIQIIEYPLHVSSQDEIEQQRRLFWLRLNHPQLVSSMYFLDQSQNQLCSSNYKGNIFIERIPLTLQTVTDIPFPDALHIYRQALSGFCQLAHQIVGFCFPISQEHIGVNCQSVCKVWMNSKFEKNFPSRNQRIQEHAMVRMIFETIEDNVDFSTIQGMPGPMSYVYRAARSPSEVMFNQAMGLFENYLKEYWGGHCPEKLACVERVGGVYNLSKNWKKRYDSLETAVRNKDPELMMASSFQQQQPQLSSTVNPILINSSTINAMQFGVNNNGYTTFRREQPVLQNVTGQDSNRDLKVEGTPKFKKVIEGGSGYFGGSKVKVVGGSQVGGFQQLPSGMQQIQNQAVVIPAQTTKVVHQLQPQPVLIQQQQQLPYQSSQVKFQPQSSQVQFASQSSQIQPPQGRVIHQIVYQNPSAVPPQVINPFSQKQIAGSIVRTPVIENAVINNTATSQRPEVVKESFIQTKVINKQVDKEELVQQASIQGQNVLPPTSFVQRFPKSDTGFVRPVISFGPQKIVVPSQQPNKSEVPIPQQIQISQPQITLTQQPTPPQQPIQSSYHVIKTTSLYTTPQNITKVQVQQIQANNNTIIQTQHEQLSTISVIGVDNNLNVRLRNEQQSISSINPQTNQVPSNEQISDKFSTMKQQPMDTSTRNFYTNMMMQGDNNNFTQQRLQQNGDYFSSYYANYTSKLYDANNNQQPVVYEVQNPLAIKLATQKKEQTLPVAVVATNNKYTVNIDDGMSSADFLSSLKNIKTTTTPNPFLKSQTNYDYGITTYDANKGVSTTTSNKDQLYKFDYKNYITKVSDGGNGENDLNIVGEKITFVPVEKRANDEQKKQYNINYEHQQGQNEAGNLNYQSQRMQVISSDGSSASYTQSSHYRSLFDKYATSDNYQSQVPISLQKNDFKLGENLKTEFSRNNTQEQQYAEMTRNTMNYNNLSSLQGYSPMQQHVEYEEYQVEYDPEILADLRKLKGDAN